MNLWALYLLGFLCGAAWIMAGMAVFSIIDPEGEFDELVMGDSDLWMFFRSLLFWPVVAVVIHLRRPR